MKVKDVKVTGQRSSLKGRHTVGLKKAAGVAKALSKVRTGQADERGGSFVVTYKRRGHASSSGSRSTFLSTSGSSVDSDQLSLFDDADHNPGRLKEIFVKAVHQADRIQRIADRVAEEPRLASLVDIPGLERNLRGVLATLHEFSSVWEGPEFLEVQKPNPGGLAEDARSLGRYWQDALSSVASAVVRLEPIVHPEATREQTKSGGAGPTRAE